MKTKRKVHSVAKAGGMTPRKPAAAVNMKAPTQSPIRSQSTHNPIRQSWVVPSSWSTQLMSATSPSPTPSRGQNTVTQTHRREWFAPRSQAHPSHDSSPALLPVSCNSINSSNNNNNNNNNTNAGNLKAIIQSSRKDRRKKKALSVLVRGMLSTVYVDNRMRLFQFFEDIRPPYFGTFSKATKIVNGRHPFRKDTALVNYDYDSEASWVDPDSESGSQCECSSSDGSSEEEAELTETASDQGFLSDESSNASTGRYRWVPPKEKPQLIVQFDFGPEWEAVPMLPLDVLAKVCVLPSPTVAAWVPPGTITVKPTLTKLPNRGSKRASTGTGSVDERIQNPRKPKPAAVRGPNRAGGKPGTRLHKGTSCHGKHTSAIIEHGDKQQRTLVDFWRHSK